MSFLNFVTAFVLSFAFLAVFIIAALETNQHRRFVLKEIGELESGFHLDYMEHHKSVDVDKEDLRSLIQDLLGKGILPTSVSFQVYGDENVAYLHIYTLSTEEARSYDFQCSLLEREWWKNGLGELGNTSIKATPEESILLEELSRKLDTPTRKYSVQF